MCPGEGQGRDVDSGHRSGSAWNHSEPVPRLGLKLSPGTRHSPPGCDPGCPPCPLLQPLSRTQQKGCPGGRESHCSEGKETLLISK